ncbi:MAG: transposase [Candidatus Cloacimonetes bacterium]|nr:transposase [Candidatus Cloacimonadota bacterium]
MYKEYKHNPPHLFVPDAKYFITVSTLGRHRYLKSDSTKDATLAYLIQSIQHFNWNLADWVILDNHLHFMATAPENVKTLSDLMHNLTRFTANWLSSHNIPRIESKYFHNYWDTCITYEKSYFCRLNYIWNNPVKHGYVESPEKWIYGSYIYRFRAEDIESQEIMLNYPIDRVHIDDDF